MTLRTLAAGVVPVVAPPVNLPDRQKLPDVPTAGGRWGKPGNFSFSASGAANDTSDSPPLQPFSAQIEDADEQPITRTVEYVVSAFVGRDIVTDVDPTKDEFEQVSTDTRTAKVIRNLAFEFTEQLPKKRAFQIGLTQRHWSYDLDFLERPFIFPRVVDPEDHLLAQIINPEAGSSEGENPGPFDFVEWNTLFEKGADPSGRI